MVERRHFQRRVFNWIKLGCSSSATGTVSWLPGAETNRRRLQSWNFACIVVGHAIDGCMGTTCLSKRVPPFEEKGFVQGLLRIESDVPPADRWSLWGRFLVELIGLMNESWSSPAIR